MIHYELQCRYCKKRFKAAEGTPKYMAYKRNRNGQFSCDACDRLIEDDARKYLFNRD